MKKPTRAPLTCTLQDFAALIGRSLPTVQAFIREGMPTLGRQGREHRVAVGPAVRWLVERIEARCEAEIADATRDPNLLAARTRKVTAEAEIAERRLALQRGDLVEREAVLRAGRSFVLGIRAQVLSLARRCRHHGLPRAYEQLVDGIAREALLDIAHWSTVDTPEERAAREAVVDRLNPQYLTAAMLRAQLEDPKSWMQGIQPSLREEYERLVAEGRGIVIYATGGTQPWPPQFETVDVARTAQ